MSKIIGIDLGTTNSVVAVMEGGSPKVLINSQGDRTTPSVVGFTDKGERLVGKQARNQQVTNPKNTLFSVKRFIGLRAEEVRDEAKRVPYEVTGTGDQTIKINVRDKEYTPQQVSAMILQSLKKTAEDYLGESVTRAVITVPAYFNDAQRQATKEAGEIAGLTVERIINEPTAAALAYGLESKANEKIAVFDFGGGTFDISILEIADDGSGGQVFEVLSTNGDTHLGGDDVDEVLIDYLAEEFRKREGIDIRNDAMALQRLKEAAERAKVELSTSQETNINLPFITADQSGPKHLTDTITRAKFEGLIGSILERLRTPCEDALSDAKLDASRIDEIVLVGGSTRIPAVQALAKKVFGKEPSKSINPDEVVALGAAIQGGVLQGDVKDVLLLDVTPLSLGVETLGGVMTRLIERNTTIPTEKTEVFSTAADSQTSVTIHVLQGEREFAKDNRSLGRFDLTDIPPAPRGMPQIEVAFKIDANGILNVSATDKASSKSQNIEIKGSTGLSDDEIDRMKKEAEAHADEDKARREVIDLKNKGEGLVHQARKSLDEYGEKVEPATRGKIESAISNLESKLKDEDKAAIESAISELEAASMELGKVMYEAEAAKAQAGAGGQASADADNASATSSADDDVVDADFKVKDDD